MCGSNNCRKFGAYFHPKDDCCDRPENLPVREEPSFVPGAPLEPPTGHSWKNNWNCNAFLDQDKDAGDGTTTVRDVVLQRTLVMKERETVTALVMEVLMMDMPGVRETWSVEATTV